MMTVNVICCVCVACQLHLVHWNCEKYKKFEDAVPSPDGLCVLTVFIEVAPFSVYCMSLLMFIVLRLCPICRLARVEVAFVSRQYIMMPVFCMTVSMLPCHIMTQRGMHTIDTR